MNPKKVSVADNRPTQTCLRDKILPQWDCARLGEAQGSINYIPSSSFSHGLRMSWPTEVVPQGLLLAQSFQIVSSAIALHWPRKICPAS